ncbi:carboxy methyl transferase for protein phosphatase 2A [Saxophila tyrrhenica]|uniref:Leucine carboxyl methyltransferase 1 n=1 Tax=Saxophila tyrrhenica TaxID=1690608 RepID=A0AAV9P6Y3_9PEZI|nr:carboxy methyl transferase for protein phosphatase 2A [Saxophila tyrrhenica]
MAAIPNLNTLRIGRGGPRRRGGRGGIGSSSDGEPSERDSETARDRVVQQTDHDASSSRMSAIELDYLDDVYAKQLWTPNEKVPKRYPIINRGTYVRTKAIDKLVTLFLQAQPTQRKQIVSLGAGSDTRFFRFWVQGLLKDAGVTYHELDFEANVNQKRHSVRSSSVLSEHIKQAEKAGTSYNLHAIDLRDLTAKSPPPIPGLEPDLPTLILSECCLCYLPPDIASSVIQYFTMNMQSALAIAVYEPIRPFDAFGKTMVSNLASRGIHLQTLKRYSSLEAQRQRMRLAGLKTCQGARDVYELWESTAWVGDEERQRIEGLEWLDEIEEWQLLASHYCVAWGWTGDIFSEAWAALDGGQSTAESKHDDVTINSSTRRAFRDWLDPHGSSSLTISQETSNGIDKQLYMEQLRSSSRLLRISVNPSTRGIRTQNSRHALGYGATKPIP